MAFLLKIKGLYSTDNVRRYEMAGQCQFNGQISFCFSRFSPSDPTEKSLLNIQTPWGEFLCMF